VVGHCDQKDDHGEVIISTDDYLWLKLCQLHVDDDDDDDDSSTEDRLTLTQLQVMLLEEYGNSSFGLVLVLGLC